MWNGNQIYKKLVEMGLCEDIHFDDFLIKNTSKYFLMWKHYNIHYRKKHFF
jgi:hypothetical protein